MRREPKKRWTRLAGFIEDHCRVKGSAGYPVPVKLLPWQKRFLREIWGDHYDVAPKQRALLTMGKKNGKTAFMAWIMLAYIVGPEQRPGALLLSGAGASRDQASILYDEMKYAIMASPEMSEMVREKTLNLYDRDVKITREDKIIRYNALSTYGRSAQGMLPLFWVLDEYAQAMNTEVFDALDRGQGTAHQGVGIVTSTYSTLPGNPFSDLVERIQQTKAIGKGKEWVTFLFRSDPEKSDFSWGNIRAANPSIGYHLSRSSVEREVEEAQASPAKLQQYRAYRLNRSTGDVAQLVDLLAWQRAAASFSWDDVAGERCRLGLDLSCTTDLSALAAWFPDSGRLLCHAWIPASNLDERIKTDRLDYDVWARDGWLSLCWDNDGKTVHYPDILEFICEIGKRNLIEELRYDRWGFSVLKEQARILDIDLPNPIAVGQGTKTYTPAINEFERLLLSGKIAHNDNPVLNSSVASTGVQTDPRATDPPRKPVKLNERCRIDCFVATLMAVASLEPEEQKRKGPLLVSASEMIAHELLAS